MGMKKVFLLLFAFFAIQINFSANAQLLKVEKDYNGRYYRYGNQRIEKSEISQFLMKNCPEAYKMYHNKDLKIGWGICVPSIALLAGGLGMSFSSSESIVYTGIGLGAAGAVGILSSVFVLSSGYDKRRRTCDVFNSYCRASSQQPLQLQFQAGPQNLAVALQF